MKKNKDVKLNFWLSQFDRDLIKQASEKIGVPYSQLIRNTAVIAAKKILATPDLEIQDSSVNYD